MKKSSIVSNDRHLMRAWDYEEGKMRPVLAISFEGRPTATLQYGPVIKKNIDNLQIMHCTGLRDKKDNRMFEWDIVEEVNESGRRRYLIEWDECECRFEFRPLNFKSAISHNMGSIWTEVTVIGNARDNPELVSPPAK